MNAAFRAATGAVAVLLVIALLGYAAGYYFCIHRHYSSIAAGVDFVFVDETTYAFYRPAIWIYEWTSGREVVLNPMVHPVG